MNKILFENVGIDKLNLQVKQLSKDIVTALNEGKNIGMSDFVTFGREKKNFFTIWLHTSPSRPELFGRLSIKDDFAFINVDTPQLKRKCDRTDPRCIMNLPVWLDYVCTALGTEIIGITHLDLKFDSSHNYERDIITFSNKYDLIIGGRKANEENFYKTKGIKKHSPVTIYIKKNKTWTVRFYDKTKEKGTNTELASPYIHRIEISLKGCKQIRDILLNIEPNCNNIDDLIFLYLGDCDFLNKVYVHALNRTAILRHKRKRIGLGDFLIGGLI